uniref:DUF423 domain-containing protein n=1 Tax=Ningiella ruwaisensis TaxID=2364274 RepID=UPI00109F31F0|nr:DUF423 domain-containing protein [Ningiella ruwaisensis]
MNKEIKYTLVAGALFALLSVAIGAFAAHGLKATLDDYALGIIETGARYQMYHALALILCGVLMASLNLRLRSVSICFTLGMVCFSGSLYLLATTGIKWLAFITPIGGFLFLAAWTLFIINIVKHVKSNPSYD